MLKFQASVYKQLWPSRSSVIILGQKFGLFVLLKFCHTKFVCDCASRASVHHTVNSVKASLSRVLMKNLDAVRRPACF